MILRGTDLHAVMNPLEEHCVIGLGEACHMGRWRRVSTRRNMTLPAPSSEHVLEQQVKPTGPQVTPVELAAILMSHTILHPDTTYHISHHPKQPVYHTNSQRCPLLGLLLLTVAHLVHCTKSWHPSTPYVSVMERQKHVA